MKTIEVIDITEFKTKPMTSSFTLWLWNGRVVVLPISSVDQEENIVNTSKKYKRVKSNLKKIKF